MPTIEEMIKTLKSNGYKYTEYDYGYGACDAIETAKGVCFRDDGGKSLYDITCEAYAHYLQQKEHAEMKALLEDFIRQYSEFDNPKDYIYHCASMYADAKEILAEKETSECCLFILQSL